MTRTRTGKKYFAIPKKYDSELLTDEQTSWKQILAYLPQLELGLVELTKWDFWRQFIPSDSVLVTLQVFELI